MNGGDSTRSAVMARSRFGFPFNKRQKCVVSKQQLRSASTQRLLTYLRASNSLKSLNILQSESEKSLDPAKTSTKASLPLPVATAYNDYGQRSLKASHQFKTSFW